METVRIVTAGVDDVPAIQRLYRQLDRHHAELLPEVMRTLDRDARADDDVRTLIAQDQSDYLVARVDGEIVGFALLMCQSPPPFPAFRRRDVAMLEDMVVDRAHRRRGVGRALLDAAVEWSRVRGLGHLQVGVWDANAAARRLYVAYGFRPLLARLELDTGAQPGAPAATEARIRRATADDLCAWAELRGALWPGHAPAELASEARAMLDADDGVCLVATDESGRIVGFLEGAVHASPTGPYGHVEGWYVRPECRRRGHGSALVDEFELWCLHRAIRLLTSDTTAEYPLSPPAHEGSGFRRLRELTIFVRDVSAR